MSAQGESPEIRQWRERLLATKPHLLRPAPRRRPVDAPQDSLFSVDAVGMSATAWRAILADRERQRLAALRPVTPSDGAEPEASA